MRKPITLLFALFMAASSFAQNIVYNPDLELYDFCPYGYSDINACRGWHMPTWGTSDYFNICNTNFVGVPANDVGYQEPASGNAYAGFLTYYLYAPDEREYIKDRLMNMQEGQAYRVSIKVSFASLALYATDGIGVLFTVDSTYTETTDLAVLPYTPHIDFSGFGVINDTTNWITLTDTFVADSAYKHLIIGNFKADSQTTLQNIPVDSQVSQLLGAYYYIDDIVVEPVTLGVADHDTEKNAVNLYPNPMATSSRVSFSNPDHVPYTFDVYEAPGRNVMHINNIRSNTFTINKGDLVPGLYYYRLNGNGDIYTGKLHIY